VRVITRNGHDWPHRFPWIVESALKNRQQHFVIDGEAVQKDYSNRRAAPEPDAKSCAAGTARATFLTMDTTRTG
jgi:hypothetical protein